MSWRPGSFLAFGVEMGAKVKTICGEYFQFHHHFHLHIHLHISTSYWLSLERQLNVISVEIENQIDVPAMSIDFTIKIFFVPSQCQRTKFIFDSALFVSICLLHILQQPVSTTCFVCQVRAPKVYESCANTSRKGPDTTWLGSQLYWDRYRRTGCACFVNELGASRCKRRAVAVLTVRRQDMPGNAG